MRIAICDDNPDDLKQLAELLFQLDSAMEINLFSTARELYESSRETAYDAVILDIEMESPNGFEIALKLAREDNHPVILFLTNSAAYAVRGYGIALRYLLKPLTADALREAMDAVYQQLRRNRVTLILDGVSHVLQIHDIVYAESNNHRIRLHTLGGELIFRTAIKDLMAQLPERWFCTPHKSYLVNLLHVSTVTNTEIHLTNGIQIPLSRRRQREFLQSFHRFLGV